MTTKTIEKLPNILPDEDEKRRMREIVIEKDSTTDTGSPNPPSLDSAKTAGVFTRDYVVLGDIKIAGESEPNYDVKYKRSELELLQGDGGSWLNANSIQFESSMQWEGPIISIAAFDSDGKVLGKAVIPDEPRMPANQTINIDPQILRFEPAQPREGE